MDSTDDYILKWLIGKERSVTCCSDELDTKGNFTLPARSFDVEQAEKMLRSVMKSPFPEKNMLTHVKTVTAMACSESYGRDHRSLGPTGRPG